MDIWTSLAYFKANPKVKGLRRFGGDGKGAYVNVACVESKEAFEERVKRPSEGMDSILVELDMVELPGNENERGRLPRRVDTRREPAAR
jgi:hypothetical protein